MAMQVDVEILNRFPFVLRSKLLNNGVIVV